MIQRIQSIYLLIGALALLSLLFFDPLWTGSVAEEQGWLLPTMLVAAGLPALTALAAIFLYKDRRRQRTIVGVTQLLTLICLAVLGIGLYLSGFFASEAAGSSSGSVAFLVAPFVAYIMFFLARRAIDRDIALVRSMDRLR